MPNLTKIYIYLYLSFILVYIAINGSRESGCGNNESNPCREIADVLFNRTSPITIFLKADRKKQAIYSLLLPLELLASVTINRYGEGKKPIIKTEQERLFIKRNNGNFIVDGIDFEMNPDGVLLELDFLENEEISFKNLKLRNKKQVLLKHQTNILILMTTFQEVKKISAINVRISHGDLLRLDGRLSFKEDKYTINVKTFYASEITVNKIIYVEGHNCAIDEVVIDSCPEVEYALSFKNTKCKIEKIAISNSKIKQTAISIHKLVPKNKKYKAIEKKREKMLRYMYYSPERKRHEEHREKNREFAIGYVSIKGNKMTYTFQVSSFNRTYLDHVNVGGINVENNSIVSCIDLKAISFKANNTTITNNIFIRSILLHEEGKLILDGLHITKNIVEPTSKALILDVGETGSFQLKNCYIEWTLKYTHSPLIDMYVGSGRFHIQNVKVSTAAREGVTVTSIEVNRQYHPDAKILDFRINCPSNSQSVHNAERSIRGMISQSKCIPCEISTYTKLSSFLELSSNIRNYSFSERNFYKSDHIFDGLSLKRSVFKCHPCPFGGFCKLGIKSAGNFYGQESKFGKVEFTSCPSEYCCSRRECVGIDSCRRNRSGILCGACKPAYHQDFYSKSCVPVESCNNPNSFWIIYVATALVACILLIYMKDIGILLRNIKERSCCLSKKESDVRREKEGCPLKTFKSEDHDVSDTDVIIIGKKTEEQLTISGCFSIIVSFYQIRSLVTFDVSESFNHGNSFQKRMTDFVNLDFNFIKSVCPMKGLNAIVKGLIKNQLVVVAMLLWSIFILSMFYTSQTLLNLKRSARKKPDNNSLKFPQRIGLGIIKIILFGYKNIATFSIALFHCVTINGSSHMFIYGEQHCYTWWQILDMFFFVFWVVPFPAALMISYRLYVRHVIPLRLLVFSIVVPLLAFVFKFQYRSMNCLYVEEENEKAVSKLLKESFEQAYRQCNNKPYYVFWETWRLYQRLILAFVTTFTINPYTRICYMAPLVLSFIGVYWLVKPYKKQYVVLHWMEVAGLLCIVNNMVYSLLFMFEISPFTFTMLYWLDAFASPIFVLVYFYVLKPITAKCIKIVYFWYNNK